MTYPPDAPARSRPVRLVVKRAARSAGDTKWARKAGQTVMQARVADARSTPTIDARIPG